MSPMILLNDPNLGVTVEQVNAEWDKGNVGKMEIARRMKIANLKFAIEYADDLITLRKAVARLMEFIR